jgi:hypothetical protein
MSIGKWSTPSEHAPKYRLVGAPPALSCNVKLGEPKHEIVKIDAHSTDEATVVVRNAVKWLTLRYRNCQTRAHLREPVPHRSGIRCLAEIPEVCLSLALILLLASDILQFLIEVTDLAARSETWVWHIPTLVVIRRPLLLIGSRCDPMSWLLLGHRHQAKAFVGQWQSLLSMLKSWGLTAWLWPGNRQAWPKATTGFCSGPASPSLTGLGPDGLVA